MSDTGIDIDRGFIAAQIAALEAHQREVRADLDHLRSVLRNDLGGVRWSDARVKVEFRPGFFKAIPHTRLPNGGLVFRRRRLDPYMKVSLK